MFSKNRHLQTAVYIPKPSQHNQYVKRETDFGKQSLNSVLQPAIAVKSNQKHQIPLNLGVSEGLAEIWITERIKQIIFPSLISLAEHVFFSVFMAPGGDWGHCVLLQ